MIEDGVDTLQEDIAENVEIYVTATLDTSVGYAIAGVSKGKVFLLNRKELATDINLHNGQLVGGGVGWEQVALLRRVIFGARNGLVDSLNDLVTDESKCSTSVSNGSVVAQGNRLSVDRGASAGELLETLAIVNGRIVNVTSNGL